MHMLWSRLMIETEIQRKIEDFRELDIPDYFAREGDVHIVKNMVSTIIGSRRSGKSFRALQVGDELIKSGDIKSIDHICHLDFDNPILSSISAQDLNIIQETFLTLTPGADLKTQLVFIFDEIHKISGWEEYVVDLSRNQNWKVIVTGSSSKLLKDNIATELRGKAISSTVYPLSFSEFLSFKGINSITRSTKGKVLIRTAFNEYLKWGGFPALINIKESTRETLLREYFDTMILKDIIQRFNISKPRQCIHLYNYLMSNMAKPVTLKSAYQFIKQSGYTTSKDSLREYINQAEDSWLMFNVSIYSDSIREQERNYNKIYFIDWALAIHNSLVWDGYFSRAFENMIFLHLSRSFSRINYYLTQNKRQEIDFIAVDNRGKPIMAVQACMDISNPDTLKRELIPLVSAAKYFNIKENLIITLNNKQDVFNVEGVKVMAIPAWQWMLEKF